MTSTVAAGSLPRCEAVEPGAGEDPSVAVIRLVHTVSAEEIDHIWTWPHQRLD